MSFVHGTNGRVLANEISASANVTGYTLTHSRDYGAATALTDSGARFVPGLRSGALKLAGLFDSAAGSLYNEVASVVGTDNGLLVTVCPDGTTIGQPAFVTVTDLSGFTVDASVADTVTIDVQATPDDGVDWGASLHALAAETTTGNGTSVDNGASSAGGGVAALHVTAYSGLTNVVLKVQHSTDNSTWADLVTFTTATTTTSQRSTVSGTVNRYVRATWTVTGTGSVTFLVAFARR